MSGDRTSEQLVKACKEFLAAFDAPRTHETYCYQALAIWSIRDALERLPLLEGGKGEDEIDDEFSCAQGSPEWQRGFQAGMKEKERQYTAPQPVARQPAWDDPRDAEIAELERLCDATYVAQGADAYNHACDEMDRFQKERVAAGKEAGCEGSLCDGMAWLYGRIADLEKPAGDGGVNATRREEAPAHNLPDWAECSLRVANSKFIAKRVADGGYGSEYEDMLASELHRFIYEYDDADSYRSAWFLHRLELTLQEAKQEAIAALRANAEPVVAAKAPNEPSAFDTLPDDYELGDY